MNLALHRKFCSTFRFTEEDSWSSKYSASESAPRWLRYVSHSRRRFNVVLRRWRHGREEVRCALSKPSKK